MLSRLVLGCLTLLALGWAPQAAAGSPEVSPDAVRSALGKSVALLERSRAEYLGERDCFSCHHQLVPAVALVTARSRGFPINEESFQEHARLTHTHLDRRRDSYQKGIGSGGQVDTAGSALWTLELAQWKPDETTAAVTEYLLLRDAEQAYWRTSSKRPPTEASLFTTTYVALRGLTAFATDEQQERAKARTEAARRWLIETPAEDTEDHVFRLRALALAGAEESEVQAAAQKLLELQQENGGWAQMEKMAPDAYATATALTALHESGGLPICDEAYQRGLAFLLETQLSDGSWHVATRSKPIQKYFESGFPHGKDQFISVSATGWAVAALALACPPSDANEDPLPVEPEADQP